MKTWIITLVVAVSALTLSAQTNTTTTLQTAPKIGGTSSQSLPDMSLDISKPVPPTKGLFRELFDRHTNFGAALLRQINPFGKLDKRSVRDYTYLPREFVDYKTHEPQGLVVISFHR